ncbi:hypothetical protein GEMRC1_005228 [Eukaryota sp. GEM-RC1]
MVRSGQAFWSTILEASADFFYITRFISIVSFVIVLGCLIVIGVFGFHRIILSISVERQGVLNLFLWVPKDTCARIVSDLQSRFKSSGAVHHEDSDDDFDLAPSQYSHCDGEDEYQQSEGTSIALTLDSHDHVDQSNGVTSSNKTVLLGLSLCLSFLVSVMFFMFISYSSNQNELFININHNFELGIAAGDLIVMDFILTSRSYSFVATGDLFFYQSYWGFAESGRRRALIETFYFSPRVSPSVKDQLASTQVFSDHLTHYQRISQSLAAQVFNHTDDDVSYVINYQYDIETEQSSSYERVEYDGYSNWYNNHTHDSSLSSSEKYLIAKETMSSSRYHNHLNSLVNAVLLTSDLSNDHLSHESEKLFNIQTFFLPVINCCYYHFSVYMLVLITVPILVLLFVFISVLYGRKVLSDWDATDTITEHIISQASTCKLLFSKVTYLSDVFILSGDFHTYRDYRRTRQQLLVSLGELVAMFSNSENSPLKSDLSKLKDSFTNVFTDLHSVFRIQDIALVLACSHYDIPSSLTPELDGIAWDIATEENSHLKIIQQQNLPLIQRYTNKTFDLSRSSSDQLLLAQHLTMGRSFTPITSRVLNYYLVDSVNEFVSSSVSLLESLRNPQLWATSQILLLVAICFTVLLFLYFLILTSPKKEVAGHVKQVVELVLINKFHKQSIIALCFMAVGIAVFFLFSIYAMFSLQPWPGQLQLAGERATLPYIISARVIQGAMDSGTRVESCIRLIGRTEQLSNTHNELLYRSSSRFLESAAGRFAPHNNLVYNTNFNVLSYNTSILQEFGLNFLIHRFISLVTPLMLQETTASWDIESPHIQEIIQVGRDVATLSFDSIDLLQVELQETVRFYRISIIMSMVLVFGISILIYVVLFRKMLNTLREEEEISLQLISMIPHSIVLSNSVIQQFVANN